MLAGLHSALTGEDTVPAEAVPVAQMTLAPEGGVSPVDCPTDHDLGRFPLEFNAWCRARLDRTPVRTVRAVTPPPPRPGRGSRTVYPPCSEQGDLSSVHACTRHFCFLLAEPDGPLTDFVPLIEPDSPNQRR